MTQIVERILINNDITNNLICGLIVRQTITMQTIVHMQSIFGMAKMFTLVAPCTILIILFLGG